MTSPKCAHFSNLPQRRKFSPDSPFFIPMHLFATPSLRKRLFFALGAVLVSRVAPAQSVYAPLNSDYYHLVDRYEIKLGRSPPAFSATSGRTNAAASPN
jgi:hypothetical protein